MHKHIRLNPIFLLIVFLFLSAGCPSTPDREEGDLEYTEGIETWHKKRLERLKTPDGWLSLAGLYWLEEGENTFGKDPSNDLIIAKEGTPPFVGCFIFDPHANEVRFKTASGIGVRHLGKAAAEMKLQHDGAGKPTVLTLGSLNWFLIMRGEKLGVRLRDTENPRIKQLKRIETFPIDRAWRIEAVLEKHPQPKKLPTPTVLGTVTEQPTPGVLVFQIKGQTYKLHPIGDKGDLFVIFGDRTNTVETYGGGRFLTVKKPDDNGKTFIDFNRAYNPPCVFSPFATCPLPPETNRLPVRVTAGEKMVEDFGH